MLLHALCVAIIVVPGLALTCWMAWSIDKLKDGGR